MHGTCRQTVSSSPSTIAEANEVAVLGRVSRRRVIVRMAGGAGTIIVAAVALTLVQIAAAQQGRSCQLEPEHASQRCRCAYEFDASGDVSDTVLTCVEPLWTFPTMLQPGEHVLLPESAPARLLTLVRLVTGGEAPVARSYDGHPWEERASGDLSLLPRPNNRSVVVIPAYGSFRIEELIESDEAGVVASNSAAAVVAPRRSASQRAAARLLLQGTFGPTLATIEELAAARNARSLSEAEAAREWVHTQLALPPMLLRTHLRRRVSPRLPPGYQLPNLAARPACAVGSRWHRHVFTQADEDKTLRVSGTASGVMRLEVDGALRSLYAPTTNYTVVLKGRCLGLYSYATTLDECTAAAHALGFRYGGESRA